MNLIKSICLKKFYQIQHRQSPAVINFQLSLRFYVKTKCIHRKLSLLQVEGRITMITEENDIKKAPNFSEDEGNTLDNVKAQQTGIKDLSMVV